jgi:hypothetical protein
MPRRLLGYWSAGIFPARDNLHYAKRLERRHLAGTPHAFWLDFMQIR